MISCVAVLLCLGEHSKGQEYCLRDFNENRLGLCRERQVGVRRNIRGFKKSFLVRTISTEQFITRIFRRKAAFLSVVLDVSKFLSASAANMYFQLTACNVKSWKYFFSSV